MNHLIRPISPLLFYRPAPAGLFCCVCLWHRDKLLSTTRRSFYLTTYRSELVNTTEKNINQLTLLNSFFCKPLIISHLKKLIINFQLQAKSTLLNNPIHTNHYHMAVLCCCRITTGINCSNPIFNIRNTAYKPNQLTLPSLIMITVISGTDRKDSMTLRVAALYTKLLRAQTDDNVHMLSLEGLNPWDKTGKQKETEQRLLIPSDKFVFVLPEYNGSFPGVLKMMIDHSDIRNCWWNKKAMLTGVADGRAGNLRGMDHMTGILNYLKVNVLHNKIPLSRISEEIDREGNLLKEETVKVINNQIDEFLKF